MLLNVPISSDKNAISLICDALLHPQTSDKLQAKLLLAISQILTTDPMAYKAYEKRLDFMVEPEMLRQLIPKAYSDGNGVSFGSAIVLPNVEKLLQYFLRVIQPKQKLLSQLPQVCFDVLDRFKFILTYGYQVSH